MLDLNFVILKVNRYIVVFECKKGKFLGVMYEELFEN